MFDLYEISENEGKGSIRAVYNRELRKHVLSSAKRIKNYKNFCKNICIDYTTFWDYLNRRNYIPLFVLQQLEKISGIKFQGYIKYLEYGAGPNKKRTKAVKKISADFAKIIGAFAADGSLKKRATKWENKEVTHYEIVFREGFKSNIYALANWLNTIFGLKIIAKGKENHYYIYISNKIVFRYFTEIFGFNPGRKTETVSMPNVIKNSSKQIKKAFVTGVLMFDGSVNYRNGYIELYSKSKELIKDMVSVLRKINIPPDYINLNPDRLGRYRFIIRKCEKLKECLSLFEPKTEKWWRLNEHLFGFDGETKSLNILITNLDKHYPRIRESAIRMTDVIKVVNSLQKLKKTGNFKNISENLNRHSTIVYEYLRKLETLKILKTNKTGTKKVWFLSNSFPLSKRGG